MKKAFTMVELIFVIVIIGILAAIAVPRLAATRDDAMIVKSSEYIVGIMTEIETYIVANGEVKDDLREMSPLLKNLEGQNRVVMDIPNQRAKVKIGKDPSCIVIDIDSVGSSELLKTVLSTTSTDKICHQVQEFIKTKDYPLLVRGKLIKF